MKRAGERRRVVWLLAVFAGLTLAMAMRAMPVRAESVTFWEGTRYAQYDNHDSSTAAPTGVKVITQLNYSSGICPYLTWKDSKKLQGRRIYVEVSTDPAFPDNGRSRWTILPEDAKGVDLTQALYAWENENDPGTVYYIRTYTENNSGFPGICSPTVKYLPPVPDVELLEKYSTKNSIYFLFDNTGDRTNAGITGFEIWRADSGEKYKKIASENDMQYTDTGLKSNTTYRYRIRAYAVRSDNQKKVYGDYAYCTMTTYGDDLQLKAVRSGSRSVRLSWKKVPGAVRYEVSRRAGESITKNKFYSPIQDVYETIATVKPGAAARYTDKGLETSTGISYSYQVTAYVETGKGKQKKTLLLQDSETVTMQPAFNHVQRTENSNGTLTLSWDKIPGAGGYRVYQYRNGYNSEPELYKTLPAKTTSYTFPKGLYRICTYKNPSEVYMDVNVVRNGAGPKKVTAKANRAGTGIQISWKAVKGAAYYRVYRSRYPITNNFYFGSCIALKTMDKKQKGTLAKDKSCYLAPPVYTGKITGTSVTDTYLGYSLKDTSDGSIELHDVQAGPVPGIRYYYFVQAYRRNGEKIQENVEDSGYSPSAYSKTASAVLNGGH